MGVPSQAPVERAVSALWDGPDAGRPVARASVASGRSRSRGPCTGRDADLESRNLVQGVQAGAVRATPSESGAMVRPHPFRAPSR